MIINKSVLPIVYASVKRGLKIQFMQNFFFGKFYHNISSYLFNNLQHIEHKQSGVLVVVHISCYVEYSGRDCDGRLVSKVGLYLLFLQNCNMQYLLSYQILQNRLYINSNWLFKDNKGVGALNNRDIFKLLLLCTAIIVITIISYSITLKKHSIFVSDILLDPICNSAKLLG